ncbi:long-chain fatty acid--CoA ligase [Alkalicaulis satelles]|uniref:Long-chain fatty acid--CoA ligase n=1 Tax=Alkalicaulis satelles TaxID=2609175 RepID=A0A5M6ZI13_9PROT|nr:long-chain fatty acid--CoA ligase [Alkalicaulis satelles]KAA5803337.1 long-chain fatty acid--CoA ligase [Alkalicaulis satelles]
MQASAQELPRIGDGLFPSTPARLLDQAERRGDAPAYSVHDGEGWVSTNWRDYAAQTRQAARALIALDFKPDDACAILGFNRPEWTITAIAAMMAGGRPAGVYWTSSEPEIAYILQHSESPVYLVETAEQARNALALKAECPNLAHIIMMQGPEPAPEGVLSWEAFMALGEDRHDDAVSARLKAITEATIGSLIYTSGTTGPPKAVMLSHGNISWSAGMLSQMFDHREGDAGLSYLPLAHIAEQQASVHNHVASGSNLYFARSMETLAEDLQGARPTVFFGVPRVWEKFHEALRGRLAEATGPKAKIAAWAMGVARRYHDADINGRSPGPVLSLQMGIARALVLNKIKTALGLERARMLISGAAPISKEILTFFTGLDLVIYEGYGQSETSAPTCFNQPGAVRLGSVGRLIDHMEARISEEGELQVKGPNVFAGYMKNNEATESTFTRDGWMRTGDVVRKDEDGFFFITGRIKDIIITSGGKNITPANIETDLMNDPLIEHAVVVGDARPYLTALVTLSEDGLAKFAKTQDISVEDARASEALTAALQTAVDGVNKRYARVENVRKFRVLPAALTVETGELTPTMKVRRNVVTARNSALIDAMYAEGHAGAED